MSTRNRSGRIESASCRTMPSLDQAGPPAAVPSASGTENDLDEYATLFRHRLGAGPRWSACYRDLPSVAFALG